MKLDTPVIGLSIFLWSIFSLLQREYCSLSRLNLTVNKHRETEIPFRQFLPLNGAFCSKRTMMLLLLASIICFVKFLLFQNEVWPNFIESNPSGRAERQRFLWGNVQVLIGLFFAQYEPWWSYYWPQYLLWANFHSCKVSFDQITLWEDWAQLGKNRRDLDTPLKQVLSLDGTFCYTRTIILLVLASIFCFVKFLFVQNEFWPNSIESNPSGKAERQKLLWGNFQVLICLFFA